MAVDEEKWFLKLGWEETHSTQDTKINALVYGPATRTELFNYLLSELPLLYGTLVFKGLDSASVLANQPYLWNVRVAYGAYQDKRELQAGECEFKFTPVKRQIKRTISISSRCYDSSGAITPPDLQIIGWKPKDERADGTTVTEYLVGFSWRVAVPASTASESWRRAVGDLQGTTNTATFFGYDAGEVLFDEIDGGVRGAGMYVFTLSFVRGKNVASVNVGGITVPNVKAWEIIDADDQKIVLDTSGSKPRLVPQVERVKVHKVAEEGDWTALSALLGV